MQITPRTQAASGAPLDRYAAANPAFGQQMKGMQKPSRWAPRGFWAGATGLAFLVMGLVTSREPKQHQFRLEDSPPGYWRDPGVAPPDGTAVRLPHLLKDTVTFDQLLGQP